MGVCGQCHALADFSLGKSPVEKISCPPQGLNSEPSSPWRVVIPDTLFRPQQCNETLWNIVKYVRALTCNVPELRALALITLDFASM